VKFHQDSVYITCLTVTAHLKGGTKSDLDKPYNYILQYNVSQKNGLIFYI